VNRSQYASVIAMLGVPVEFHQNKAPGIIVAIPKVGIATPKPDQPGINAYTTETKVITILQTSLPVVPEKFDWVMVGPEKMVFSSVHTVHEPGSGAVIGYRCVVGGK
jgi:hypothetical protein